MKRHLHVGIWTVGWVTIAFVLFVAVLNVIANDESAPDDSALRLNDVTVADSNNAFFALQKIETSGLFPTETVVHALDRSEAVTYYADQLVLFSEAAEKGAYQNPDFSRPSTLDWDTVWDATPFPSLHAYRQIAIVAARDARQTAESGNVTLGLAKATDIVRVGFLMETGQAALVEYLVGSAMRQIGFDALRQIALSTSLTAEQATLFSAALEEYRDTSAGQIAALKFEFLVPGLPISYRDYIKKLFIFSDGWPWKMVSWLGVSRFYYYPNQTWRYSVDASKTIIANAEADCRVMDANVEIPAVTNTSGLSLLFTPNAIGKYFTDVARISWGAASVKRCNESVATSATQVALAVSAFTKDNGHAPATLADLVPTYLVSVPLDPYTGDPLVYSAEKKTVYSLGPQRTDIGGSPVTDDWQHEDNPSFLVGR